MEELEKLLQEKAGLSDEQSKQAVEIVIKFIKERVPAPYDNMIDGLLDGKLDASDLNNAMGLLGGLFGKK